MFKLQQDLQLREYQLALVSGKWSADLSNSLLGTRTAAHALAPSIRRMILPDPRALKAFSSCKTPEAPPSLPPSPSHSLTDWGASIRSLSLLSSERHRWTQDGAARERERMTRGRRRASPPDTRESRVVIPISVVAARVMLFFPASLAVCLTCRRLMIALLPSHPIPSAGQT